VRTLLPLELTAMHHGEMSLPVMDWVRSGTGLLVAFALGTAIGYERQYRQRTAGLRTNTLVALSSAIFVDMAYQLDGPSGAAHVAAYVVSGVGFITGSLHGQGVEKSTLDRITLQLASHTDVKQAFWNPLTSD
jgi:hypothetical protein